MKAAPPDEVSVKTSPPEEVSAKEEPPGSVWDSAAEPDAAQLSPIPDDDDDDDVATTDNLRQNTAARSLPSTTGQGIAQH